MHEPARAKINLFLHVTGKRTDGYHDLHSLVVFADAADVLHAEEAEALTLSVSGPFAASLPALHADNLVLRAAHALRQALSITKGAALRLEKHLPVASGIGGGSADAAACLRLLARLWKADVAPEMLERIALSLGSDVPACLHQRAIWMSGRGEHLQAAALPGVLPMVLVNPGVGLSTKEVFGRFSHKHPHPNALPSAVEGMRGWLKAQRNDLQESALSLAPQIADVLERLEAQSGCQLARMSGSGATCFGLFRDMDAAERGCDALRSQSDWWVRAVAAV